MESNLICIAHRLIYVAYVAWWLITFTYRIHKCLYSFSQRFTYIELLNSAKLIKNEEYEQGDLKEKEKKLMIETKYIT